MKTFTELTAELGSRLMSADNSTLYTTARKEKLIQDAHLWATSYKEWVELVRAKTTTSTTDDYYDCPDEFRTDSIIRVVIDGNVYKKKNYEDFLDYLADNADYLDSYVAGKVMDVYGCIQPEQLSGGTDTTIFSDSDETGNEAIVKKALSVALKKNNPNLAVLEENEAKVILENIWRRQSQRQHRDERLNHPLFNVPNYFGRSNNFTLKAKEYFFADYQRKIFIASFN